VDFLGNGKTDPYEKMVLPSAPGEDRKTDGRMEKIFVSLLSAILPYSCRAAEEHSQADE